MKILYIENIRLPTEKAHGIQIMKMCEAFANLGHEVILLIPNRKNKIKTNPFEFYGIKKNFEIKKVWVPNILFLGSIGFYLQTLFFAERSAWFMYLHNRVDIVYSREERILINLIFITKNIIWESHRGSWNLATKIVANFAKKIVVISKGLEKFYLEKKPKLSGKIVLAPDGVDLSLFNINLSKDESRLKLALPRDIKIALYAGHLYKWKGAHILAQASTNFNDNEIAVFVGGTDQDLKEFREEYGQGNNKRCMILGQKPYSEIPLYLKSADVLILPNGASENIGSHYTSPLKLFEYMASGTPIVASNVPAIREILDESNSTIFTADNSKDLHEAIEKVFKEGNEIEAKALKAKKDVEQYTWISRAKNIIDNFR